MLLVCTFVGKGNIKSGFMTLGISFHFIVRRVEIEFHGISKKSSRVILVRACIISAKYHMWPESNRSLAGISAAGVRLSVAHREDRQ